MRGCVVALCLAGCGRLAFDPLATSVDATTSTDASQLTCSTESFDATPAALTTWSDTNGFDAVVSGGQLRLQLQPSTNGYAGVDLRFLDLTDGSITVEAVQVGAATRVESYIEFGTDNNNLYTLNYSEGTLGIFRLVNGTRDVMSTMAFSAASDRWWRLQHHAATHMVEYLTSPDGTTWQMKETVSDTIPVTAVLVEAAGGAYGGGNAAPGTPVFDNFTYCVK